MEEHVSYGDLARVLRELGFRLEPSAGDHLLFRHESTDATVVLPQEKPDEELRSQHLVATRRLLVERGIASTDMFDRMLAQQTLSKAS